MKLILAQGNPEKRYDDTRHNIGFALLDNFAKKYHAEWSEKPRFQAITAEVTIDDQRVLLIKPTTYYNETGISARALSDFYKTKDILVIHDDLALPFGTVRVRSKGSDAGNNGIKSLNTHLGEAFRRIRIGTWSEQRNQINDIDFVLGKLSIDEKDNLKKVSEAVDNLILAFVNGTLDDHSITIS